jgi:hypothetical protein
VSLADASPHPWPPPETDMEDQAMTTELNIAMLKDYEHVIPLPLVAHTRDVYVQTLRNPRKQRLTFFNDSPDKLVTNDIDGILEEFGKICNHLDLILSNYSSQREMSIENVAKYVETISTKCIFIAELLTALRSYKNKHLVILSRRGRMQEIIQALLFWHRFERQEDGYTLADKSNNSLRVSLLPSVEVYTDVDLEGASMIIAFSPTHAPSYSSLRVNKAGRKVHFVSLIITHSIEHLNLCFGQEIRGTEMTWALVTSISQIQDKVGKAAAEDYPPPPEAALMVARLISSGIDDTWPVPQVPVIQGIELDILSNLADSTFEVQPSGSTTQSSDILFSQQSPLAKRQLVRFH